MVRSLLRTPHMRWLRRAYHQLSANRSAGLQHELAFWQRWFATGGSEWPHEYQRRLDPQAPLAPHLQALVVQVAAPTVRILDVGAGPLTVLGKTHPTKQLQITATDLLANQYAALLRRHAIRPLVPTLPLAAEQLARYLPPHSFDLVYAQNSLDHTRDPWQALRAMLAVTKLGGYVVLEHEEDEAEQEDYVGLHQWNFSWRANQFWIRGQRTAINVSQQLANIASVSGSCQHGWLVVTIHHTAAS